MIQRIQSVFLFLAAALNLAALFVPMWRFAVSGDSETLSGMFDTATFAAQEGTSVRWFFGHGQTLPTVLHTATFLLILGVSAWLLFVIFGYQDRLKQIRQGYLAMGLLAAQILVFVLLTQQQPTQVLGGAVQGMPQVGFALPALALVFTWLAVFRIRKDEELVRSVDRIR
ncbi:MAG: hypothetical protein OHK0039_19890 [Bacteroidia bacterium]